MDLLDELGKGEGELRLLQDLRRKKHRLMVGRGGEGEGEGEGEEGGRASPRGSAARPMR